MTVLHQITGYSKSTERVVHEIPLKDEHLGYVRDVFGVSIDDDPDLNGGAYPLPAGHLSQLTYYFEGIQKPETCEWFLEAYSEPAIAAA